ncbi:hypothetical protein FVEG_11126 [Fusarium verticillioides 7600]|uniref:Jacalin-type lectin domain-containing protein n=1 Tax=Gibberella moniliformis (strain M3125 / FGSC 7600) TaxID=334819 RepID=W7MMN7_GIBM7|nr:hypothetical protein FVEG_11126 [Fusarium verticillioides 7600]EWG52356.1 hypothetical protein FVEG_11126 [Fusarium verticillioides 7600]
MKLSYLFPFVGLAQAVPTTNPSHPSIFDNPTIPVGDTKDLPDFSHIRRATAATQQTLNVSYCEVTVKGDQGFWQSWLAHEFTGHLYVTQGIPSPGTKNGDNIYDVYLQSGSFGQGGYITFATNKYLLPLPYKIGGPNVDYAKVSMTDKGYILSEPDYSNIDKPATNSPLVFYSERSMNLGKSYGPPTRYVASGKSYLGVKISDKGIVDGVVQLIGEQNGGLGYIARVAGWCRNFPTPIIA